MSPLLPQRSPCFTEMALAMPETTGASQTTDRTHPPLGGSCRGAGIWLGAALQSSASGSHWVSTRLLR